MYRQTRNPHVIIRTEDGLNIPEGHPLWDDYQQWLVAGNTPEPAPEAIVVIDEVTMRQARLQLLEMGLLPQVSAAIAAMAGEEGERARIEWEYAATVRRDNPTVAAIMAELTFTPEQIDTFFSGAAAR